MNPSFQFPQQPRAGWTRIDALLALYDSAIDHLEAAASALEGNLGDRARFHLSKAGLFVNGSAAGAECGSGEMPANILWLYAFVRHNLTQGSPDHIQAGLKILRTLRKGFEGIRPEAVALERAGQIPSFDPTWAFQVNA